MYELIFYIIIFLAGFYFCATQTSSKVIEGMSSKPIKRCPNILVQKGSRFFLYNSNLFIITSLPSLYVLLFLHKNDDNFDFILNIL